MEFSPPRSFVEAPFFSSLSDFKLNKARLSEATVPLKGTMAISSAVNRPPSLLLSNWSLDSKELLSNSNCFYLDGELSNLNTMESFKELDKIAYLRSKVQGIVDSLRDAWLDPSLLLRFAVISYADLKKYRFFYWVMFPALSWTAEAVQVDRASPEISSLPEQPVVGLKDGQVIPLHCVTPDNPTLLVVDFGSQPGRLPWHVRNLCGVLALKGFKEAFVYIWRGNHIRGEWIQIRGIDESCLDVRGAVGWERNSQNRLLPKFTDLSSLMDPLDLAEQAVDLNLRLMKWRAAPELDLDTIKNTKCLLLGAGTLGCYISRGLLAWGVRNITLVDNGTVSYSNPVRQPLFVHEDSSKQVPKAEAAAQALRQIFPGCIATGVSLDIPMAGHPVTNDARQHADHDKLVDLIDKHDVIFLLMDSRESRWLPTVITQSLKKTVINVALGFDSFLVMRHGVGTPPNLGCYFCNDVVAPIDSVSRLPLDQMCTVTRPGVAMLASANAVELLAQIIQHPERSRAPAGAETPLGSLPHQLRGFLKFHETKSIWGPSSGSCSACSAIIVSSWQESGWDFVKRALNDQDFVTELSGLGDLQRQTENLGLLDLPSEDDDKSDEDGGLS